jgi:tetratricopeptide (TPR) repeat protein
MIAQPPIYEQPTTNTTSVENEIDAIPRFASQSIPLLLKPMINARIAAIPLKNTSCAYSFYATEPLDGQYDALWVEMPALTKDITTETFDSSIIQPYLPFLKEDGILELDFNARSLNTSRLLTRISILKGLLPNVQLWMTGQNRWQLVASKQPITTSYEAIATLFDREEVSTPMYQAGIPSPFALLVSCFTSDATPLMVETMPPFTAPCDGRYLLQDFSACYDYEMPWVITPEEDKDLYNEILGTFRLGRRLAYAKDFKEASKLNAYDPYLIGLAQHERINAKYLVKLGKIDAALNSYNLSFTYAEPLMSDILEAADIAMLSGQPDRAKPYYDMAADMANNLDKQNPFYTLYLKKHLKYLEATGEKVAAETAAINLALAAETDEERRFYQFEAARIYASFPKTEGEDENDVRAREDQALERAKRVLDATPEGDERRQRIQAYADLMKQTYRLQEGILIGLHVKKHGTLISDTELPKQILNQRRKK